MDERVLKVLVSVARELHVDDEWPPTCTFCYSCKREENKIIHDTDCETQLAREVLSELDIEW